MTSFTPTYRSRQRWQEGQPAGSLPGPVVHQRRGRNRSLRTIFDSPRTSLNNSDDLASALYRRVVTLVDAARDRLQVIIGDNETTR